MPHRSLLVLALVSPLAFPSLSLAPHAQEEEPESPLHEAMEALGSGMRELRRHLGEGGDPGAALATIRLMQERATTAYGHPPAPEAGGSESATALWHIAFRRRILEVLGTMLDLEQALLEGRAEDARASYAALNKLKAAGHDQFQIEDE